MRKSVFVVFAVFVACLVVAGSYLAVAKADSVGDPPLLVPWNRVGDITLGEPRARVEREYGSVGHGYHLLTGFPGNTQGYYVLHGGRVDVNFQNGRVEEIDFAIPYYRTRGGFGVGSKIPLGPCRKTRTHRCGHRWHGFLWKEWYREGPCSCWVKVGLGKQSLPPTVGNFLKPWIFIDVKNGRIDGLRFASRFVD